MAQSLETLRSANVTSLWGRRAGLQLDETLVVKALKETILDIQTTAQQTVNNYGITRVLTTGSSQTAQHLLPAPIPGVAMRIVMQTTSTGSQQFLSTAAGAAIISASDGTTKAVVNMTGPGGSVTLMGMTTAIWAVVAQGGTTVGGIPTFTTST